MDKFISLANQIRDLVAKDKLKDALKVLNKSLKDFSALDEVILQQARFEDLSKKIRIGTLEYEHVNLETNRIRKSLLELVRELEHQGKAEIQVFISYSQKSPGHELAKTLHDQIEEEGFVAFLDTEDIRIGEDWAEFILGSLRASDYFILLLSEDANTSEMVLKEVLEARKLKSQYGKPIILPVQVQWPKGLRQNHKLFHWLKRIQHLSWEGATDTDEVIEKLLNVIKQRQTLRLTEEVEPGDADSFAEGLGNRPFPDAPLEIPQGSVLLNSPFYISRKNEKSFINRVTTPKALLRIKGPRQYGKTSLLSRIVAHAKEKKLNVVTIDFQSFSELTLKNNNNLLWEFGNMIASEVDKEDEFEDYWDKKLERRPDRDKKQVLTTFVQKQILADLGKGQQILIAMDEADRIFPYQEVSDDFFSDVTLLA